MKYQNVIYPEKDYREFAKLLFQADPSLEEELEDQDVIDAYNAIKEKDPSITNAAIAPILGKLINAIKAKMGSGNEEDTNRKLSVLQSLGE